MPALRAHAACRTQGRDDHAFGALSAELYVPRRRIGFLVCRPNCGRQGVVYVRLFAKNQAGVFSGRKNKQRYFMRLTWRLIRLDEKID